MVLSTLYMGGYLLSTNQLSAGEVMAYLMASQTIQRSLAQISLLFGSVVRGLSAGSRIFEVRISDNIFLQPNYLCSVMKSLIFFPNLIYKLSTKS